MDQGIIQNLKVHYRKRLLRRRIYAIDSGTEFKFNLLDAVFILDKSWQGVTATTISNCFRKAGFTFGEQVCLRDLVLVMFIEFLEWSSNRRRRGCRSPALLVYHSRARRTENELRIDRLFGRRRSSWNKRNFDHSRGCSSLLKFKRRWSRIGKRRWSNQGASANHRSNCTSSLLSIPPILRRKRSGCAPFSGSWSVWRFAHERPGVQDEATDSPCFLCSAIMCSPNLNFTPVCSLLIFKFVK